MIAILTDEDFNARIIRGLMRRVPAADILTSNRAHLTGQPDRHVVAWAASNQRVLVTHDVNSLIEAAIQRIQEGLTMPGIIAVPQRVAIGVAIEDLCLIIQAAEPPDMDGQIWYLPL